MLVWVDAGECVGVDDCYGIVCECGRLEWMDAYAQAMDAWFRRKGCLKVDERLEILKLNPENRES
jgi:hypothetical protein